MPALHSQSAHFATEPGGLRSRGQAIYCVNIFFLGHTIAITLRTYLFLLTLALSESDRQVGDLVAQGLSDS